jgi:aerobic carbon-monoxide dehydrogenase small subunit
MSAVDITVTVNGKARTASVPPRLLLSDFIRHTLNLLGTHVGSEHGVCGTCNVLVNGRVARSCLMFAVQADGAAVTTVEALGTAQRMHPLQHAFWEEHGLQCGFCTPGMLMSAYALLQENPDPTREEAREAVSDNLCRCTGYQTIVDAILSAAAKMREEDVA